VGLIYLDASVLIPLLVADGHTTRAVAWYSNLQATLIVSDLANLEVSAVVSRHQRKGRFTREAAENALMDFDHARQLRTAEPRRRRFLARRAHGPGFLDEACGCGRAASGKREERRPALATFDEIG
jgi:predicted nucleic acid-binding protein